MGNANVLGMPAAFRRVSATRRMNKRPRVSNRVYGLEVMRSPRTGMGW